MNHEHFFNKDILQFVNNKQKSTISSGSQRPNLAMCGVASIKMIRICFRTVVSVLLYFVTKHITLRRKFQANIRTSMVYP